MISKSGRNKGGGVAGADAYGLHINNTSDRIAAASFKGHAPTWTRGDFDRYQFVVARSIAPFPARQSAVW